ncbi:Nn.00g089370.m01.CDS01 [Neocucurbitaria sp. VM-36]
MDEPARKRRKTNSPEERERQSSPLRKPPRRPSFASPTKASLARNYPNLLRPTSAGGEASRPSSRGDILARGKQARAFVLGQTDTQKEANLGASEDVEGDTTGAAQEPLSKVQNVTPRAQKTTGHRSAPIPTRPLDEDEADLPTTPSQRGLEEQDEPRRGILYSSPSKRPPRMKDPVKQSPLRPKAPPVQNLPITQSVEVDQGENDIQAQQQSPPDPEVERRKQEKAQLQRELEDLEAQVSKCTQEITREQHRAPDEAIPPTERTELINCLSKIGGADSNKEQPAPVSSLLCSFLPFSAIAVPPPRSKPQKESIPSHRPIDLANPLPYLEMFTSLKVSTQLSPARGKISQSSKRVQQKHTIGITGPQKLLTTQVSVVIDTLANEINDMHVLRLSTWAERELGTFIRGKAKAKDLGNACWAIDSYWGIAQKRAQYWHKLERAFTRLLPGQTSEDTENAQPQAKPATSRMSRKDLNRHLGRDTLVLQDKHVLLKINWQISFDWTGEAGSVISVEPALPQVWHEADTAASFKKIPETFTTLVKGKGAYEATRIMVALLFAL